MTAAQFAKIAKVSKGTVLHWIRKGELPATQVQTKHGIGYEIEMDVWEAQEWLEDNDRFPVGSIVDSRNPLPHDVVQYAKILYAQDIDLSDLMEKGRTATVEQDLSFRARAAIHAANIFYETANRFEEDET